MNDQAHQYRAFILVVLAMLIVCILPVLASWQLGVSLPDGLLSIADKGITAFGTLLGTIGGLMFRQNGADATRADTANKAMDAVQSAIAATPPGPVKAEIVNPPERPAQVEEVQ